MNINEIEGVTMHYTRNKLFILEFISLKDHSRNTMQ